MNDELHMVLDKDFMWFNFKLYLRFQMDEKVQQKACELTKKKWIDHE